MYQAKNEVFISNKAGVKGGNHFQTTTILMLGLHQPRI